MRFRADRDFRRGVAQRVCRAPPGQAVLQWPGWFSGMALPSGFAVFSGLAVCAPDGRRPTRRERSALPILPRGAEFGLSLWSFLLLAGFIWNFGSHFELWNGGPTGIRRPSIVARHRRGVWVKLCRMRPGAIGNLITGIPVV